MTQSLPTWLDEAFRRPNLEQGTTVYPFRDTWLYRSGVTITDDPVNNQTIFDFTNPSGSVFDNAYRIADANYTFTDTVNAMVSLRGLSANRSVSLRATPSNGQKFSIADEDGSLANHTITVLGNGHNVNGAASYVISNLNATPFSCFVFEFNGSTWNLVSQFVMQSAYAGRTDPRWFGGKADGATDARAAIAAADVAGQHMVLAPGTWRVASNLTINNAVDFTDGAVIAPDVGVTVTFAGPIVASRYQRIFAGSGECVPKAQPLSWHWYQLSTDGTNLGPAAQAIASGPFQVNGGVEVELAPGAWTWADQPTPVWDNGGAGGAPVIARGSYMLSAITLTGGGRQRLFVGNQHGRYKFTGLSFVGTGSAATVDCTNIFQFGNAFEYDVDIEAFGVLCSVAQFGQFLFNGTGRANISVVTSGCGVTNGASNGGKVNVTGFEGGVTVSVRDLATSPIFGYAPPAKYTGTESGLYIAFEETAATANGTGGTVRDSWFGDTSKYGIQIDPYTAGTSWGRLTVSNVYISGSAGETAGIAAHDIDTLDLRSVYFRQSGGSASSPPLGVSLGVNVKNLRMTECRGDVETLISAATSQRNVFVNGGQGFCFDIEGAEYFEYIAGTPGESLVESTDVTNIPLLEAVRLRNVKRALLRNVICDLTGPFSDGATRNALTTDYLCGSLILEDCTFALIDFSAGAPAKTVLRNLGIETVIRGIGASGSVLEVEQQLMGYATAAVSGTATTLSSFWVPPGATMGLDVTVRGYPTSSAGGAKGSFRRRVVGTYDNVNATATADDFVAPATSNPTEDTFAVCTAPYKSGGGSPSTVALVTGIPQVDRVAAQVTNQASSAMPFSAKALLELVFPNFNPSLLATALAGGAVGRGLLGSMLELMIDSSSFQGTDGNPCTGVLDKSGKNRTVTVSTAPTYRAVRGPASLPGLDFGSGGLLTVTGLPSLQNCTILAFGTFSGTGQVLASLSSSSSSWAPGGIQLASTTISSQLYAVCQRNGDTPVASNGAAIVAGAYHCFLGTAFRGVDGTQPYGANIWLDGVAATPMKNVVTMGANTFLSVGNQQGAGAPFAGVLQFLAILSQAPQS